MKQREQMVLPEQLTVNSCKLIVRWKNHNKNVLSLKLNKPLKSQLIYIYYFGYVTYEDTEREISSSQFLLTKEANQVRNKGAIIG